MALASFPMIIRRWRRSKLFSGDYAQYTQLREYLPEDIFLSRMDALEKHTIKEYPHIWIDTYLFLTAIMFVIATAAFSIIARAANLSMWYPLIMLSVPAVIAYFTTKRRNAYYRRLASYYEALQSVLKEFNSLDVTRQIKWSFRRLRDTDTALAMHLPHSLDRYNINFVIEVIQIDTETELAEEGEILPAYDTSMMDIVLDIGPETEQRVDGASPPLSQAARSSGTISSHPLPPAYENDGPNQVSIELQPIQPPPAYLPEPVTNISRR